MDDIVKYNICSFDIEASSSHGDFPLAIKDYKKLATNILENYNTNYNNNVNNDYTINLLKREIKTAFRFDKLNYIDEVYPKILPSETQINNLIDNFIKYIPANNDGKSKFYIEEESSDSEDEEEPTLKVNQEFVKGNKKKIAKKYTKKDANIFDMIKDDKCEYSTKLHELTEAFNKTGFPELEGDIITFIGLSFINYSEKEPYKRVLIVKGGCQVPDNYKEWKINNKVELICKETEKEVLLEFTKIINEEQPHIITGYNITGFDFDFMFKRSKELDCIDDFLKLSKNRNEICINTDWRTQEKDIENSKISLASGEYNLKFPKMPGVIIMDMCVIFRKEFTLSSYKLDFVSSYFISDSVKNIECDETNNTTKIYSSNLKGLNIGTFIKFEEIGYSNNQYKKGKKFEIVNINNDECWFVINSCEKLNIPELKYNWGLAKDDVSPHEIFALANGSDFDRWTVGKYCLADCDNVIWLLLKVDVITDKVEMSNLCTVPLNYLLLRGQSIKLLSFVSKKCGEKNTLMAVIEKKEEKQGYEGAHVFEPVTGLYLEDPVACVDYSSLYPSSIISENLSHDSKVWTKEYDSSGNLITYCGETDEDGKFIYDNLPRYKYIDVKYDTFKYKRPTPTAAEKKIITGYKISRYAQFPEGEGKAIMPSILEELLAARKATRKLIPGEKDEFKKNILDKRQLSIKMTANSLYGQIGAGTSQLNDDDVASSTTAIGRKLLFYGRAIIEECYNNIEVTMSDNRKLKTKAQCVYGDSVTNDTPIYIRVNYKNIEILTIEELGNKYGDCKKWNYCEENGKQEKLYMNIVKYIYIETWSSKGWTKLERIIKHKLHESKNIIRVLTHTGLVNVTDDHSLLKKDETIISPKEINIGTELLHKTLNIADFIDIDNNDNNIDNDNINIDEKSIIEAKISGFFFGDGSCGIYNCPSGKKNSWALNNKNLDLLNYYKNLCIKVYPDFEWKINDTLKSSGVYKLTIIGNKIKDFIKNYREKHYYNKNKIIPENILNSCKKIRQAFWDGLYDADGDKDNNGYIRIDQKSQISAANICLLANSLGFKTSINNRKDKPDIFRITCTKSNQRKNSDAIKKIENITAYVKSENKFYENNELYVYDLTTSNHHFGAGIGNMIVHNTDSVFFKFNLRDAKNGQKIKNKEALIYTIELAKQAGELASKFLKKPHDLEYEKTFWPWALLSKKRYVGMLYEENPDKGKMKYMGIVLKRRDNAPIVKDIYGGVVEILMKEKSIKKSIKYVNKNIESLIDGKFPIEKLLVTKSLRGYYKNPNQIAHKVLAERIGLREPGNKPGSGDRMNYAYIKNSNKKALQGEKIETPDFIKENNLTLDYGHYISNQIMKPLLQLFALELEKIEEYKFRQLSIKNCEKRTKKMLTYEEEIARIKEKWPEPEKICKKIEELRCKEVKACLFDKYLDKLK